VHLHKLAQILILNIISKHTHTHTRARARTHIYIHIKLIIDKKSMIILELLITFKKMYVCPVYYITN